MIYQYHGSHKVGYRRIGQSHKLILENIIQHLLLQYIVIYVVACINSRKIKAGM